MAREWFVLVGNTQNGPLQGRELKLLAEQGRLRPDSLVKRGNDGQWFRATNLRGITFANAGEHLTVKPQKYAGEPESAEQPLAPPKRRASPPRSQASTIVFFLASLGILIVLLLCARLDTKPPGSYSTAPTTSTPASSSPSTDFGTARQRLTTENVLYDSSTQSDLRRMASLCGYSEERVGAMTWKTQELLHEKGIEESKETILAGMLEAYPRATMTAKYEECLAAYATAREKGLSHNDAVEGLKAFLRSLGLQ